MCPALLTDTHVYAPARSAKSQKVDTQALEHVELCIESFVSKDQLAVCDPGGAPRKPADLSGQTLLHPANPSTGPVGGR
jgi:hypothetical protein